MIPYLKLLVAQVASKEEQFKPRLVLKKRHVSIFSVPARCVFVHTKGLWLGELMKLIALYLRIEQREKGNIMREETSSLSRYILTRDSRQDLQYHSVTS
jgi:predicted RNase H-like nuclease